MEAPRLQFPAKLCTIYQWKIYPFFLKINQQVKIGPASRKSSHGINPITGDVWRCLKSAGECQFAPPPTPTYLECLLESKKTISTTEQYCSLIRSRQSHDQSNQ